MTTVENKLLDVTKYIEKQVDATIEQIDNLTVNDYEALKKARLEEMKKLEEQKLEWKSNGHGKYEELPEEKEFFNVIKKSKNVVLHFFTNTSERSKILDKHLKVLAPKHIETRFASLNAEKCPFLCEKLRVKTIPSLVLIHESVMVDKIVGFSELGNVDDFTTEVLEWRIAQNKIINYEDDLSSPPEIQRKSNKKNQKKIRDGEYNENDDIDNDEYTLTFDEFQDSIKREENPLLSSELTPEEAAELDLN